MAEVDWGGVNIRFADAYSKRNLRFYFSDKPIARLSTGINPTRKEYEKYQVDVTQRGFKLKNKQQMLVINMGKDVARFTLSGLPKPLPEIKKPKVIVNNVGNEEIVEQETETKVTAPAPKQS